MQFTDHFIKRPVLATVISLLILALGIRSMGLLPISQYPFTQNAVVTINTVFTGADPALMAGFVTTPLENAIAQASGIDYMDSSSTQSVSSIGVTLLLNYDPLKALSDITAKINGVLNQLPTGTQPPSISVAIGETIDSMYMGFYSDVLSNNKITDYLTRVVQPKLQAVQGVQTAEILGGRQFAMRAWLDPAKLAGFNITPAEVATALANNDFIAAVGRTDGNSMVVNLTTDTGLTTVEGFRNMVIKSENGAIIRLGDLANVSLGATNYDSSVGFDGKSAVYIGIKIQPAANLLSVIKSIRQLFPIIQSELPEGLRANIVYDASAYVNSSIHEVIMSLSEAILIVTIVIFLFLGSIRSVIIPLVAIPLSLIGAFFIMRILGYSINLLTLLALVLAIGLVVDDAIIVVENIQRHIEEGKSVLTASLLGAKELAGPIIAITVVLIAVYVPIGFMGGLTGALFTEFAFSLAAAVTVSAIIALTLSPMMCSKLLLPHHQVGKNKSNGFSQYIDKQFGRLQNNYERILHHSLNYLPIAVVFAIIILASNYFLFQTSKSELAPQEDQGIVLGQLTTAANSALAQTQVNTNLVEKIFWQFKETEHTFQVAGANGLNSAFVGMVLKPWDDRKRTSNILQPLVQKEMNKIAGAKIAAFQLPSLPGGGRGLPIQFVVTTTEDFNKLNTVTEALVNAANEAGMFMFIDPDLKIDRAQTTVLLNRDKIALLGLTMQDIGRTLGAALSQGYINYFNYMGRSYQVIPQMDRAYRINEDQLLNYYIKDSRGTALPLSTVAGIKQTVVPESINHFQQLNAATISAIAFPGVSVGEALSTLKSLAQKILPEGYYIDYASQSRQFIQEGASLMITFFFALIIIFLSLAALFESFRDPLIVLVSVPMSICGAMIFICLGIGGATLNIYSEVGLVTLIGLISKHGILIVQFANDLQLEGKSKREAVEKAAAIRLRPILMTTAAMVLGVIPLIIATGAGAVSRFNIGLVIAAGISIGTLFTLFVVPAMYMLLAAEHHQVQ